MYRVGARQRDGFSIHLSELFDGHQLMIDDKGA
jgi:hypothetical protein